MMQSAKSAPGFEALSDEALEWIIRLHDGQAGAAERQAWRLWCDQSEVHAAAAIEAEAIWSGLGGAIDRWQGGQARARLSRRMLLVGGAGGLLALAGWQAGLIGRHLMADHQTTTAERRGIWLRDGTEVLMNAKSAISETGQARGAELIRGQALFTVTAEGNRPFTLQAAGLVARVQRGALDVDLRPGHMIVTAAAGAADLTLAEGRSLRLVESQRILIPEGGRAGPVEVVDLAAALAWQRGKLIFDERPLADLASELERYRGGRVVVIGEALAARRLTGVFDLSDTDAILEALPQILPAKVNRLPLLTVIREA